MELNELVGLVLDLEAIHDDEAKAKNQFLDIMSKKWDEAKQSSLYQEEINRRKASYQKFFG